MKEIIGDLREVDPDGGDTLADNGVVQEVESALLDCAGKVVRIKITKVQPNRLVAPNQGN